MIDWLAYLKFAYELLKNVFSLVRRFTSKGIILDFTKPFSSPKVSEGPKDSGGGCANYIPDKLSIYPISLVAENKDQNNPALLQEITARLDGLEDAGWTSGSCTVYFVSDQGDEVLHLPKSLKPREQLPIKLLVRIGFARRDAESFVEEFRRLENKQQRIRVEYTVWERDKAKTKKLEKGGINLYALYCPGYTAYLQQSPGSDPERAKRLLKALQAK